ncbi:ubiquitin-specific protease doa4 [Maudiozyma exigua]|uniref:Ubiquitin carboxyl-terminal hydrolase n=1 Tax=Maudiozyma exigua TaxID=34358 RepID=A0A9P6W0Q1_MAUEX|nr:ubiquitin-specific protease doa4 [Kazachstania exigua]
MHFIDDVPQNSAINYFSNDVNSFIIKYGTTTDIGKLLDVSTTLLKYYNELANFLLRNPHSIHSNKIYLDELYKIAYDYYQKLFFLLFVKGKQTKEVQIPELLQLQMTLQNTLSNDISIMQIRKYLQNTVDLNETRSVLEINHISMMSLQTLLGQNHGNVLIIDCRPFSHYEANHVLCDCIVNVFPKSSNLEFTNLNFESLVSNCSTTKEALILENITAYKNIVICTNSSTPTQSLSIFVILTKYFISSNLQIPNIQSCQMDFDKWKNKGGEVYHNKMSSSNPFLIPSNYNTDIIVGLENEYNSCYINCILQCLIEIKELTTILLSNSFLGQINYMDTSNSKGSIITTLAELEQRMLKTSINNSVFNQRKSSSCFELKKCCGLINPMFNSNKEEDCIEFCDFLINHIHDDLHKGTNSGLQFGIPTETELKRLSFQDQADTTWNSYLSQENNIIVDIFQGQMASILQCQYCLNQSNTFQVFSTVSLMLPQHHTCNIHDCLKQFYKPDMLTGNNEWQCTNCKQKRPTIQRLEITKFPSVLIIQLNRFSNYMIKNTCFVKYPYELDLSSYHHNVNNPLKYELFGVVCHTGTMERGHYSSYVKKQNNIWWHFDDTVYRPVHFGNEFISQDAYILFYKLIK